MLLCGHPPLLIHPAHVRFSYVSGGKREMVKFDFLRDAQDNSAVHREPVIEEQPGKVQREEVEAFLMETLPTLSPLKTSQDPEYLDVEKTVYTLKHPIAA